MNKHIRIHERQIRKQSKIETVVNKNTKEN